MRTIENCTVRKLQDMIQEEEEEARLAAQIGSHFYAHRPKHDGIFGLPSSNSMWMHYFPLKQGVHGTETPAYIEIQICRDSRSYSDPHNTFIPIRTGNHNST